MGNTRTVITRRGKVVLTVAWFAVLLVGMVTANLGVPGWGQ